MKTFLCSVAVKVEWNVFLFRSTVSGEKYIYFFKYVYIHIYICVFISYTMEKKNHFQCPRLILLSDKECKNSQV